MRFLKALSSNPASGVISPRCITIHLGSRSNQSKCYVPGSMIHGRVHLQLNKPLSSPCELTVVFACRQTTTDDSAASSPSNPPSALDGDPTDPSTLFEVDQVLFKDRILPGCRRQGPFYFSIKLPLCNFPPSLQVMFVAIQGHVVVIFHPFGGGQAIDIY